jgi:SAM-dependent methyltransferase
MTSASNVDLSKYDTDKSSTYIARYQREFAHLLDKPIKLLELGVQRGGSMYLWRDLLPKATIVGLDLNEISIEDDSGRIHVYRGYQQDPEVLDRLAAERAPDGFDVIIDDASHLGRYTAESFWHLFPRHLKPGGIYVIEDWGCGYWPAWSDGHVYTGSRAALGDFGQDTQTTTEPSRVELVRRRVRGAARPIAAKLSPERRARLERLYMRAERATMNTRFPSHDYGMVGFVKQLVDAAAIGSIDRASPVKIDNGISSIRIDSTQVYVYKKP